MPDIKDERLSQLIAQIHSAPSPEEAFSKWMFIDIFIIDGLMMAFVFLLVILRDLTVMTMIGSGSVAFGAVYLYMKNEAKKRESLGRNFLDSQTIVGDMEIAEQIGIDGYEYIVLPEATIEGKEISYKKVDLDEVSQALASPYIRFGGESMLRPSVVDKLLEQRLVELRSEAERRVTEHTKRDKAVDVEVEEIGRGRVFGRLRKRRIKTIGDVEEEDLVEEVTPELIWSEEEKPRVKSLWAPRRDEEDE